MRRRKACEFQRSFVAHANLNRINSHAQKGKQKFALRRNQTKYTMMDAQLCIKEEDMPYVIALIAAGKAHHTEEAKMGAKVLESLMGETRVLPEVNEGM